MKTPVFLPGESHGQRSLAGYDPSGCTESDTTEATQHVCTQCLEASHPFAFSESLFVPRDQTSGFRSLAPSKKVYALVLGPASEAKGDFQEGWKGKKGSERRFRKPQKRKKKRKKQFFTVYSSTQLSETSQYPTYCSFHTITGPPSGF